MKIEMGESLFYSWLRHVKECRVVQTNWKVSGQWDFQHEEELNVFMEDIHRHFYDKYGYRIFKNNSSLSQIIQQGECDAIGISMSGGENRFYAVDVAFHGGGLNYGTREETVMKVIAKTVRTAMCLYGYMNTKEGEIIFASPKITPAVMRDISECVPEVNSLFRAHDFNFEMRIIANEEFNTSVLQPILLLSDGIADTSELFVRSYQMFTMFSQEKQKETISADCKNSDAYKEIKIGRLAQTILGKMLEEGFAAEEEILLMQQAEYSRKVFDLGYPLLVRADSEFDKSRYYVKPLVIYGTEYYLCSQWFETAANNDRIYLLKWIEEHTLHK